MDKEATIDQQTRQMKCPAHIAIVAPDLSKTGGLRTVAHYLSEVIEGTERYTADLVSLALSSRDRASVRLTRPDTWQHGVQLLKECDDAHVYTHVGARGAEVEYLRYQPRPALTQHLQEYDLVQVVAGTPAWAQVCKGLGDTAVALQVATLTREERATVLQGGYTPAALWRRWMAQLTDRLDHKALQHVDVAFVENAWMRDHLRRHMDPDAVVFAPPGVDTERFRPETLPSEGDYILCVGRLGDPRKNVRMLFEAYAHVREHMANAPRLVLAGLTGPPPAAWAYAEQRGLREEITFHEAIDASALPGLYGRAAIYAVSSDEEGLGLTVLEAMAAGRPVVSTNCGGPATTIVEGTTGRLTPVGDAEALGTALVDVLKHSAQANAMGHAGRVRAERSFSLEATGQRFLATYDQMLSTVP